MLQYYFCKPEKSKEIIKTIPKEDKYEALIYENMLYLDFSIPRNLLKTSFEIPALLLEYAPGDDTVIQISEENIDVTIKGYFEYESIFLVAKSLGASKDFLEKASNIDNPSCPIEVLENKNREKENFIESLLSNNLVESDVEW